MRLWNGFDTIKLGYYVEWADMGRLTQIIETAIDNDRRNVTTEIAGEPQAYDPVPRSRKYRWGFSSGGISIHLSNQAAPDADDPAPNVWVEWQPMAVARRGIDACREETERRINLWGGHIGLHKVSEVHMTADCALPLLREHWFDQQQPLYATRSRSRQEITETTEMASGKKWKYLRVGTSQLMCRIYNKALELQTNYHKSWERFLWTNPQTTIATRVEFQLRREAIKTFGIDTLDDLKAKATALWHYLTHQWMRADNPIWQEIQEAWETPEQRIIRCRPRRPRIEQLRKQCFGCATTLHAMLKDATPQQIAEWIFTTKTTAGDDWETTRAKKSAALAVKGWQNRKLSLKFHVSAVISGGDDISPTAYRRNAAAGRPAAKATPVGPPRHDPGGA